MKIYGCTRIQFKMIATEGKTITTPLVHFGTCLLGLFSSSHSLTLSRSKQDCGVLSLSLTHFSPVDTDPAGYLPLVIVGGDGGSQRTPSSLTWRRRGRSSSPLVPIIELADPAAYLATSQELEV